MLLQTLTAEETAFLSQPLLAHAAAAPAFSGYDATRDPATEFSVRLAQGLALTLGARLRLPLHLVAATCEASPGNRPRWRIGPELAGLWLARRQGTGAGGVPRTFSGGQGGVGHVPSALLRTLDAVLAERWLDAPAALPAGLAWRLSASDSDIALALDLPSSMADMQRWARETITS